MVDEFINLSVAKKKEPFRLLKNLNVSRETTSDEIKSFYNVNNVCLFFIIFFF